MQALKTSYCFIPWWRSWWPATSIFVNKLWECCPPRIATEWAVFHQFPQCERTNHIKTSGASKKKIVHFSVLRLQFLLTQTNFSSKMVQVEQMVSKLNRSDFQPNKFSFKVFSQRSFHQVFNQRRQSEKQKNLKHTIALNIRSDSTCWNCLNLVSVSNYSCQCPCPLSTTTVATSVSDKQAPEAGGCTTWDGETWETGDTGEKS